MLRGKKRSLFFILLTVSMVLYLKTNLVTAVSLGPYSSDADTVLLLHFDEGKRFPKDSSSYKNKVNANTAKWIPNGKFGKALQFDGVDNKVSVSYDESLSFTGKLTCEAWIKNLGEGGNIYQMIVVMGGEYFLALAPNRRAVFVHNWDLKPTDLYVNFDGFLDEKWHHVAFIYDGTTRKIYIDGELKNSDTPSGSIKPNAQGVSIGYWYANTGFNGLIDEIRISKEIRSLTPSSVALMPLPLKTQKKIEPRIHSKTEKYVVALYMPGFSSERPTWRTQVDLIRMDFSGDSREDRKREMILAKESGIDAFIFNHMPRLRKPHIKGAQEMAGIAKEVGFKIMHLVDNNPGFHLQPEDLKLYIEKLLEVFSEDPTTVKIGNKMLIPISDVDYFTPQQWKEIFDDLKKKKSLPECIFIAYLRSTRDKGRQQEYLRSGFSGIFDGFAYRTKEIFNQHLENLRETVEEVVPGGLIMAGQLPSYWRVEYGLYQPSNGTSKLREDNWEVLKETDVDIVNVMSWNDFAEDHHHMPSLYRSSIRGNVIKHYIALMRGQKPPAYEGYHLYYTFRRSVLMGELLEVELLNFPNNKADYYATCEIRASSGELLKELKSPLINAASLQAVKLSMGTGSLPEGTRVIELWGTVKDKEQKMLLQKKIGFVALEPIINQNYLEISRLITEIPEVDLKLEQSEGKIKLAVKSQEALRDLHLQRSDFIRVKYCQEKRILVKFLVTGENYSTPEGAPLITMSIDVTGGEIWDAVACPPLGQANIIQKSKTSVDLNTRAWGAMNTSEVILELSNNENMLLNVAVNKTNVFAIPIKGLREKSASYVFGGSGKKILLTASLTDEDMQAYKPLLQQELTYSIKDMTRGSSHIWGRRPVEIVFARAMNETRRWVDSSPIVVNYEGVNHLVKGYGFDWESKKTFPMTFYENEKLIANWDFNNTTESGVISSQSSYDYPLCLGGKGDLSFPYLTTPYYTFFGKEQLSPKLVQDNDRRVAEFDGEKTFVYGPVSIFPCGGSRVTVTVKPIRTDERQAIFSDKRYHGANGRAALYILPGGKVEVQYFNDVQKRWEKLTSRNALNCGQWYKIEIVYNLKTLNLFVDGKLEGILDMQDSVLNKNGANLIIGAEEVGSGFYYYFKGLIAAVKIEAYIK